MRELVGYKVMFGQFADWKSAIQSRSRGRSLRYMNFMRAEILVALLALLIGDHARGAASPLLQFSHNRGFYDTPFKLAISTKSPETIIRFTTNGSTPSRTNGV